MYHVHNSAYSVTLDIKDRIPREPNEYVIDVLLDANMSILDFCDNVNSEILKHLDSGGIQLQPQKDRVIIELGVGYEVHIPLESSRKMLTMLHSSAQNSIITETKSFKYKPNL